MELINKELSPIEIKEVVNRANGMRDDEKRLTLQCMPTHMLNAELDRRQTNLTRKLDCVYVILENVVEGMSIDDMQKVINDIKAVVTK